MSEMRQAIEATGEDVERAISSGLVRLGVDRDAVEIEVLDNGSRGLFGLGARAARVRLTLKQDASEPLPEPLPEPLDEAPHEIPDEIPVEREVAEVAPGPDEASDQVVAPPTEEVDEEAEEEAAALEQAKVARGVMIDLLSLLDMEGARVDVRRAEPARDEEDPPWLIDVRGPGVDALVGRHGETLAALQYITRLIVGREMEEWVHLVVDVDGFKARREKSLRSLARRLAQQAVETNRTVTLEPMPPHERRIIHLELRNHSRVKTQSIGEGERRKVTIIPQRSS